MLDFAATPKTADPGSWKCDLIKNPFNQLLSSSKAGQTTTYQYDGRGNQVRKTEPRGVTAYTYDSRNVMTEISPPIGNVNRYGYDPQNLRVSMEDSQGARRILLDGLEEYGEYDTSSGMQLARYDHDPLRVDGLLNQARTGDKHCFNSDALGSIYGLTGSDGQLASTYSYDVYGARTSFLETTPTSAGFTGRRHEGSTLTYHRARYLDLTIGRFPSRDQIGLVEGPHGSNDAVFPNHPYLFGDNNTPNITDPLGLFEIHFHRALTWSAVVRVLPRRFGGVATFAIARVAELEQIETDWYLWGHLVHNHLHAMADPGESKLAAKAKWEDFVAGRRWQAKDAVCRGSIDDIGTYLGKALHAIQDHYAHPYFPSLAQHQILGMGRTDSNPSELTLMNALKASEEFLQQFLDMLPDERF